VIHNGGRTRKNSQGKGKKPRRGCPEERQRSPLKEREAQKREKERERKEPHRQKKKKGRYKKHWGKTEGLNPVGSEKALPQSGEGKK